MNVLEDPRPQKGAHREAGLRAQDARLQAPRQWGLGLCCAAGPVDISAGAVGILHIAG